MRYLWTLVHGPPVPPAPRGRHARPPRFAPLRRWVRQPFADRGPVALLTVSAMGLFSAGAWVGLGLWAGLVTAGVGCLAVEFRLAGR